jgi:hypothetical protein
VLLKLTTRIATVIERRLIQSATRESKTVRREVGRRSHGGLTAWTQLRRCSVLQVVDLSEQPADIGGAGDLQSDIIDVGALGAKRPGPERSTAATAADRQNDLRGSSSLEGHLRFCGGDAASNGYSNSGEASHIMQEGTKYKVLKYGEFRANWTARPILERFPSRTQSR